MHTKRVGVIISCSKIQPLHTSEFIKGWWKNELFLITLGIMTIYFKFLHCRIQHHQVMKNQLWKVMTSSWVEPDEILTVNWKDLVRISIHQQFSVFFSRYKCPLSQSSGKFHPGVDPASKKIVSWFGQNPFDPYQKKGCFGWLRGGGIDVVKSYLYSIQYWFWTRKNTTEICLRCQILVDGNFHCSSCFWYWSYFFQSQFSLGVVTACTKHFRVFRTY